MTGEIQSIVRALSNLAWADGRLDPREESMLHKLFLRLGLTEEETTRALAPDQAQPDLQELGQLLPTEAGRRKLIRLMLELSFADDVMSFEEFLTVKQVARQLEVPAADVESMRDEIRATLP